MIMHTIEYNAVKWIKRFASIVLHCKALGYQLSVLGFDTNCIIAYQLIAYLWVKEMQVAAIPANYVCFDKQNQVSAMSANCII